MSWYLSVLRQYAVFTGRARRREYWMFTLVNLVIGIVLALIDLAIGGHWLTYIYSLALVIPTIAVTCRRLHDTDRSGWWQLIGIIPVVGTIILLVFLILDGRPTANRFGPSPKYGSATNVAYS